MPKGLLEQKNTLNQGKNAPKLSEEQIAKTYDTIVGEGIKSRNPQMAKTLGMGQGTVPQIGQVLAGLKDPDIFNTFFDVLNQATASIYNSEIFTHPLSKFKKAYAPTGGYILKSHINPPKVHAFNANSTTSPFQTEKTDIIQEIHSHTLSIYAEVTLQDTHTHKAIANWEQFDAFVGAQMQSLPNALTLAEYNGMKDILSLAVMSGSVPVNKIPSSGGIVDTATLKQRIKTIASNMVNQPSNEYNVAGRWHQPQRDNLSVILTNEVSADIDVNLLANMYNAGFSDAEVTITRIDKFNDLWFYSAEHTVTAKDLSEGWLDDEVYTVGDKVAAGTQAVAGAPEATKEFDGSKVYGAILSNDSLIFVDQLLEGSNYKVANIVDPKHRRTNMYGHIEQIQSLSPSEPSVYFVADDVETVALNNKTGVNALGMYHSGYSIDMTNDNISLASGDVIEEVEVPKAVKKSTGTNKTVKKTPKRVSDGTELKKD